MTLSPTDPLRLRGITVPHRLWLSPMCQYSSVDGYVDDWHIAHLGARAVGGAALVMTEATAVTPDGRISPTDLGIWDDDHVEGLGRLVDVIEAQGGVPAVQIAHAGAKSSAYQPWIARGVPVPESDGGWTPRAESDRPDREIHVLTPAEIADIVGAFRAATVRAREAGFKVLEIHGAHGYLIHSFLSPATNRRTDAYGGDQGRRRFAVEVTRAVREEWPDELPLFFRVSATDWLDEDERPGWTVEDTVDLTRELAGLGVDLIDVSSGGLLPGIKITTFSGYQVPFAARIRRETRVPTSAVGRIDSADRAASILAAGDADAIFVGRAFLRDPMWARHVLAELGVELPWPMQYGWAVGSRRAPDDGNDS